jgi:hypothetical protein
MTMRPDHITSALLILALAVAGSSSPTEFRLNIPPQVQFRYLYYSDTNGHLNIGVRADGTSDIGEHYDRATEARKLLEMVKTLEREGAMPDCHETGYSPIPRDGTRRIDPGTAWPHEPTAIPVQWQDARPDDEIMILRNQLHAVQGVAVRMSGIDTIGAMRLMTDRLIEIDQRLERLERK